MPDIDEHRDRLSALAAAGAVDELAELLDEITADWGDVWPEATGEVLTAVVDVLSPDQRAQLQNRLTRHGNVHGRQRDRRRADILYSLVTALSYLWEGADGVRRAETELTALSRKWHYWHGHSLRAKVFVLLDAGVPIPVDVLCMLRRSSRDSFRRELRGFVETLEGPVLNPGEAWSDAVLDFLRTAPPEWTGLIANAGKATSAKPSARWLKETRRLIAELGETEVRDRLGDWLRLVGEPRTIAVEEPHHPTHVTEEFDPYNVEFLRGLIWTFGLLPTRRELLRLLDRLIVVSQRKIPGVGVRSQLTTNAAVHALSMIDDPEAVGQLARLAASVTFKPTLKSLNKALDTRAAALGISRDEVEELAVPDYGLTEVGHHTGRLGEAEWEVAVTADGTKLLWRNASGKTVKSPPAEVKRDHADTVKELKALAKDVAKMVTAQSERLDRQFLTHREWRFDVWRRRYLDHPLVGTVARRLIWVVGGAPATYYDDALRDADAKPLDPPHDAPVTLWHPIGRELDEILAWRDLLERHGVVQPFKQAHREVYLLTAAEQNTRVYSNRFAAHILRQHQYNALAKARGWDNQLRLMVDDAYEPTTKHLPQWGLRAEFWVEGVGDDYGAETTEAGTYLRLVTDQVRFYRQGAPRNHAHAGGGSYTQWLRDPDAGAEPLPLAEIPPLVLSEVLRDVDLFVGVSSLGNDPEWSDGGPEGRFRDYWHSYSFGELGATAVTRRDLLQRLVPRLAIADRAEVDGRFLRVRGDIRTYKIHLGSGNILMEPDNEYLCIVPKQAGTGADGKVFLPFEGDRVLSLILSKALLLARDTAITDSTITSQINRGR